MGGKGQTRARASRDSGIRPGSESVIRRLSSRTVPQQAEPPSPPARALRGARSRTTRSAPISASVCSSSRRMPVRVDEIVDGRKPGAAAPKQTARPAAKVGSSSRASRCCRNTTPAPHGLDHRLIVAPALGTDCVVDSRLSISRALALSALCPLPSQWPVPPPPATRSRSGVPAGSLPSGSTRHSQSECCTSTPVKRTPRRCASFTSVAG